MNKLLAVFLFLVASTAAQAQYTFEYGGRTIRIDPDRGTVSIPGVYDNTGRPTKAPRSDREGERQRKQAPPEQAKADPQPTPAAPAQPALPANPPAPATGSAGAGPTDSPVTAGAPAAAPAPAARQDAAPAATNAAPVVATAPVSSSPASPPQTPAGPAASTTTPLGLWLTEEKEGKIRIVQCGGNLCGYSVDAKSNQNGEQVLINMKPGKDRWSGRIFDPNTGSTYESTIALKGPDSLRVQGCAFGGMFCGGQTWTRLN